MADQIIANPTPKSQFLSTAAKVADHNRMVQMPIFQESINATLLEYQRRLTANMSDANAAAAVSFKLKGALEFVDILVNMGLRIPDATTAKITKLDHTV